MTHRIIKIWKIQQVPFTDDEVAFNIARNVKGGAAAFPASV
jgi:hypothetical protein